MEQTTFFEHYRICKNDGGSPNEVGRIGAAISYKAIDTRTGETVLLQLIPLATVDQTKREQFEERARTAQKLDHVNIARIFAVGVEHDHFGLASEYLEGETADSWVVAHGLIPVDAVLRIALQVVRAMAAAAFFNLTHRAIQPSNIMIVPGQSPDDGWPFVKLLNFGLAGLELHSISTEARELAPRVAPQFASPEQLRGGEIDFRSEMYSLGATLCFLLTGAAPLAEGGSKARFGTRRLPPLRGVPRPVHKLLARMLRENPEDRPQDPVVFEAELRDCLNKVENRQAIRRRLGIPLAAVIPTEIKESRSPLAQISRGVAVFAVLMLAATGLGAYFFPSLVPIWHRTGEIGTAVGVPDASPEAAPGESLTRTPAVQNGPIADSKSSNFGKAWQTAHPIQAAAVVPAPSSTPPAEPPGAAETASTRIASSRSAAADPVPPSEGPARAANASEDASMSSETNDSSPQADTNAKPGSDSNAHENHSSASKAKRRVSTPSRQPIMRRAQAVRRPINESEPAPVPRHQGWVRARLVGVTPDGRMILRLPSGRTVFVRQRLDDEGALVPRDPRRVYGEPPPGFAPPPPQYQAPYQPFND